MYKIPIFPVTKLGNGGAHFLGLPTEDADEMEALHKTLRADASNVPDDQSEQFERLVGTAMQQLFDLLKQQYRRRGSAFNEYVLDVALPDEAFRLSLGLGWLPARARAEAPTWRQWIAELLEGRYSQVGWSDSCGVDPYIFVKFPPEKIEVKPLPKPASPAAAERKKPGPKRNLENARKVKEIVEQCLNPEGWKDDLEAVCKRLDADEIPSPNTWRRREIKMESWSDGAALEPTLAIKAIKYQLKTASRL